MADVEIVPEPEPDEREAILAALAAEERPMRGAWGAPEEEDEERL